MFGEREWYCKNSDCTLSQNRTPIQERFRCPECQALRPGIKVAGIVIGSAIFLLILIAVLVPRMLREFKADIWLQRQEGQLIPVEKDKEIDLPPREGYKIKVKTEKGKCHLYAFKIKAQDEENKRLPTRLFPNDDYSTLRNPLRPGSDVVIPDKEWLQPDEGDEAVFLYLIVSLRSDRINELYKDAKDIKTDTAREERRKKTLLDAFYERLKSLRKKQNLMFRKLVIKVQKLSVIRIVPDNEGFKVEENRLIPDVKIKEKAGRYRIEAQADGKRDYLIIPVMKIEPVQVRLKVGEKVNFGVVPSQKVSSFGVEDNIGSINDKGEFIAKREGEGKVTAEIDGLTLKATVIVEPHIVIGGNLSNVVAKSASVTVTVSPPGSEYEFEIIGTGEQRGEIEDGTLIWGYFNGKLVVTVPGGERETITLKFSPNSSPYEELNEQVTISKETTYRNLQFDKKGEK